MIDVETARTFLAIIECGTFKGAAEKVHITQSTVSARIKGLEDQLGQTVFDRGRGGAQLTIHGHHFERYARAIVRAWEQGRQQAGVPPRYQSVLTIGGQYNLWNRLMPLWLEILSTRLPATAFRAEAGTSLRLSQMLSEGILDMAVLHQPRMRTDIVVEEIMQDELIMVSASPSANLDDTYVYIDWGEDFRSFHAQHLPEQMEPRHIGSVGFSGARYLLALNGTGYMPRRLVSPMLAAGYLHEVDGAPVCHFPLYVAYQKHGDQKLYTPALTTLCELALQAESDDLPSPFWMSVSE